MHCQEGRKRFSASPHAQCVHSWSAYTQGVFSFFQINKHGKKEKECRFFFFKLVTLNRYNYIFSTSRGQGITSITQNFTLQFLRSILVVKHLSLCKQQLSVSVFVRIGAGAPPPCPHPARPRYLLLEMKELLSSESCHFGTRTGLSLSSTAGAGSEHRQLKTQNKPQVRICLQRCWQKNHPETTQGTSVSGSEG